MLDILLYILVGLMIIIGGYLLFFTPKNENSFISYSTYLSIETEQLFKLGNKYFGKYLLLLGILMLIIHFSLSLIIPLNSLFYYCYLIVFTVVIFLAIAKIIKKTEHYLRKNRK